MTVKEISVEDAFTLANARKEFPDAWNENMIKSAFDGGRFFGFIASENDRVLGFITLSKGVDDCDIESVFVYSEFRKKGVATSLLDIAINKVKEYNIKKIFLEVRKSNFSAINLYEKFGFEKISQRKKYYGDGEDAFVFVKEI